MQENVTIKIKYNKFIKSIYKQSFFLTDMV